MKVRKTKKSDGTLFEALIPDELKPRVKELLKHDARSHKALRWMLDEISDIALTYRHNNAVTDFLSSIKARTGRPPKNAFHPFFKWLRPSAQGSRLTEWSEACVAAEYFKMKPSAALDDKLLGNGEMRKLISAYREHAELTKTQAPKAPRVVEPELAPMLSTTNGQHIEEITFKRMPIGRAVIDAVDAAPSKYGGRFLLVVERPTDEKVFHVFDVRPIPEQAVE
jgi:hypothetical protein